MRLYSQSRLRCSETGQRRAGQINPLSFCIQWGWTRTATPDSEGPSCFPSQCDYSTHNKRLPNRKTFKHAHTHTDIYVIYDFMSCHSELPQGWLEIFLNLLDPSVTAFPQHLLYFNWVHFHYSFHGLCQNVCFFFFQLATLKQQFRAIFRHRLAVWLFIYLHTVRL